MPTYEYKCSNCNYKYTIELNMDECDPKDKECPFCKEKQLKRVFSVPNFILRGSGWSKDGYVDMKKEMVDPYYPKGYMEKYRDGEDWHE